MYILNVSYIKTLAEVEPQVNAHREWVTRYVNEGTFLFAGPKKSGLGGVIAVKNIAIEELKRILSEDSYIQSDVAEYQIIDFDCKLTLPIIEWMKQA